jgi:hypothetical protein
LGGNQQVPINNAPTGVKGNGGENVPQAQGSPEHGADEDPLSPTGRTNVSNPMSIDISAMVRENMEEAGLLRLYDMLAEKEEERRCEAEERETQHQLLMAE